MAATYREAGNRGGIGRVLITGGRGQLGTELQRLLRRAGVPYEALDLPELDITDEQSVQAALTGAVTGAGARTGTGTAMAAATAIATANTSGTGAATATGAGTGTVLVIHAAAFTAVDRAEDSAQRELAARVNIEGTRHVARACATAGFPLVYISTDFVFGGEKRTPYEVDDEPAPLSVYGATKLAGEQAVRELCRQHYIVRTAWVYGVYGQNFPRAILGAAAKATAAVAAGVEGRAGAVGPANGVEGEAGGRPQPLRVVDDQVGCPTYAHDLAEAVLLLAGVPVVQPEGVQGRLAIPAPFGTYHVTNGGSCSWYEFAREIVRLAGWPVEVTPIRSTELNRRARRPAYSVLSPAKLRSAGLELRPWPAALRAFLAELRADSPELFPTGKAVGER